MPKWADQDDKDPKVGDALEEELDESSCSTHRNEEKVEEEEMEESKAQPLQETLKRFLKAKKITFRGKKIK